MALSNTPHLTEKTIDVLDQGLRGCKAVSRVIATSNHFIKNIDETSEDRNDENGLKEMETRAARQFRQSVAARER